MKILYVSRERTDAEVAVAALRTAAQNVTVLWTSRLEHLAKWIDQNQDLVALIVDALVDRTGWRPVLEHVRRLAAPPTLLVIAPVGAGPDFELLGADEFLIKNESLGRELAVAVRRAVDRARERQSREAVNSLEQELAHARAALQESEERHRVAIAEAAEELARQQARHEIGLARAAATWEMVDEQLREAAIEVERSRREQASASASVQRLLRRESELSTRLAEASSTRAGLEQRVAETAAALDAANARAADELRAAAEEFAEHRRDFEARIALEIETRIGLESAVARAVSERESAEQRHAVAIADSTGQVRDLEAALHLAQEHLESQAANIDRLTKREAELTSLLADATTSRRDVERRLAATEAAFQEADTRATRDRLATARRAAEREATLDGQIQEERAARSGLEQSLAEANAALHEVSQQRDAASEAFALERAERQAAFDQELAESASQFETRLADERQSYEIRLTEMLESNAQLTRERDAFQQSLDACEEQLRCLDVEHRESHERFEEARTAAVADIERLTAECTEGRRTLESARHDFQQTLDRVAGEHDAALAARDREIDQLRVEIAAASQRSECLFDGAQLATFRCSRDGTVTKANRAWSALVRRTIDDMRDADGVAAVFESPNDLSWLIERSLSTSTKESIETTLRRKDGARLFVRLSARAWGSNVIEIVAEDFTRARVLQDRLAQAARMEAVGRLASEVALTCGTLLVGARENAQQWLMDAGGTAASRQHGHSLLDDLTRAGNYLQQLVAYGDKQRRTPGSVDLTTVVRNLAPVLKHVAGGHVDVRLPARSSSLTVDLETEHVERLLVNLAAYGRERMPLGRLTIEVGTSIVDRHFTAKYPNVRPGPHALITVREARRPLRPDAFVRGAANARDARGTVDYKRGIELGTIQGLVGDCGGHLWMKVEPLGDIVAKIRLPLLTSEGQTHARALAAVGGRARALTRWFQH